MDQRVMVTAIVGSYRKGGIIDLAVDEILASAAAEGAEVAKIYLIDKQIEFCTNCRACTQEEGQGHGHCSIDDEMGGLLETLERSDSLVLASPMNFFTVTALMKRFIERLVCFAYWPWGTAAPKTRSTRRDKRAVLVISSAAPSLMARWLTGMGSLLKRCAGLLGAKTVGVLYIGFAAKQPKQELAQRAKRAANRLGKRLASHH